MDFFLIYFLFNIIKDSITQYFLYQSPSNFTFSFFQHILSLRAVIALWHLHYLSQITNLLPDLQYQLYKAGSVFFGAFERIRVKDSEIHPLIRIQKTNLANLVSPFVKVPITVRRSGSVWILRCKATHSISSLRQNCGLCSVLYQNSFWGLEE